MFATTNFDPTTVMQTVVTNENAGEDSRYQAKVASYNQAVQGWITANVHSREMSSDPQNFQPTAPPTVPTKTVYSLSSGQVVTTTWQDPSIQPPTLPAYVPPQTANGFASLSPTLSSAEQDYATVTLSQIQADVKAIRAKLGA